MNNEPQRRKGRKEVQRNEEAAVKHSREGYPPGGQKGMGEMKRCGF
jgi:hypothetical protein